MDAELSEAAEQQRECLNCGKSYSPSADEQKFCSNQCKRYAYMLRRHGKESADWWLSRRSRRLSLGELRNAEEWRTERADLLDRLEKAEAERDEAWRVASAQVDLERTRAEAAEAALERVRAACADHWDYQTRRESKFGREGSSCICGVCDVMRALAPVTEEGDKE